MYTGDKIKLTIVTALGAAMMFTAIALATPISYWIIGLGILGLILSLWGITFHFAYKGSVFTSVQTHLKLNEFAEVTGEYFDTIKVIDKKLNSLKKMIDELKEAKEKLKEAKGE